MTKKKVINSERMRCWLACIYVNWDPEDDGYHDIAKYGIGQADIGQCLSWLTIETISPGTKWMDKIFNYVIHDIADNYEFEKDALGGRREVRYWKRAVSLWRQ
jgi:hypothetical protein